MKQNARLYISHALRMKKHRSFLGLMLLTLHCFVIEGCNNPTNNFSAEDITFTNEQDGALLAGTFTKPIGIAEFPIVILISGSGQQDRDETVYGHKPFKVLAEFLSNNGIGVLRYDDRGIGGSTGDIWGATVEVQASDAYAGIRYLRSRSDVDLHSIGIIGHSLGAMQGTLLASKHSDISFLIMLGGIGMPWAENHIKADILTNKSKGVEEEVIDAGAQLLKSMCNEMRNFPYTQDYQTSKEVLSEIVRNWRTNLYGETKKEIERFTIENPTWTRNIVEEYATPIYISCAKFDPARYLLNIDCPVLSIIGEKDIQAIPENNDAILGALKEGGNTYFKIITAKDINHMFQKCETGLISEYEKIDEEFNVGIMTEILQWIKSIP